MRQFQQSQAALIHAAEQQVRRDEVRSHLPHGPAVDHQSKRVDEVSWRAGALLPANLPHAEAGHPPVCVASFQLAALVGDRQDGFHFVQRLLALAIGPPESRLVQRQIRADQVRPLLQYGINAHRGARFQRAIRSCNKPPHPKHGPCRSLDLAIHFQSDLHLGLLVVVAQWRLDPHPVNAYRAGWLQPHVFPNPQRVHGNAPVPAAVGGAFEFLELLEKRSGTLLNVRPCLVIGMRDGRCQALRHPRDTHGKPVPSARLDCLSHVEPEAPKHAGIAADALPIHPHVTLVVHAIEHQGQPLPGEAGWHVEIVAVPPVLLGYVGHARIARAVPQGLELVRRFQVGLDVSRHRGRSPIGRGRICEGHTPLVALAVGVVVNPPVRAAKAERLDGPAGRGQWRLRCAGFAVLAANRDRGIRCGHLLCCFHSIGRDQHQSRENHARHA